MLDEIQERPLGPVDVVEDHNHRASDSQRPEERPRRAESLLRAPCHFGKPDHPGHSLGDEVGALLLPQGLGQLGSRLVGRVAVFEPDRLLDCLGERPEGDAVAVWQAAAAGDERAATEIV